MKISAVIPTRNRTVSLRNTLKSLLSQTRCPDEIIVIDASDVKDSLNRLQNELDGHGIIWIDTSPSVCLQRNTGIKKASGNWIFLCDDDIELKSDYLQTLELYVKNNKNCGAVAGRLLQLESNGWVDRYPVKNLGELLWRFVFQLSVWGDIDRYRVPVLVRPVFYVIEEFYRWRGNTLSLSGWPIITQWNEEGFQTKIFSLGANLIKKDWFCPDGYDEVLDRYGIGDNYGVAVNFPGENPIHVLASTCAYHHRAGENRLSPSLSYYRRVLALHYFIIRERRRRFVKTIFFIWSLFGNSLMFFFKKDSKMFKATCKAMWLIATARNPYSVAKLKGEKTIEPYC